MDEDGVVSCEELEDRLKEVRDADPVGHEARLKQSQGQFMDKKVTSQQIDGHTNSIRFSHAVMWRSHR
eukprot:COSAG02_NODE_10569_length_1911_cov_1.165011_2_plen_68_part_00